MTPDRTPATRCGPRRRSPPSLVVTRLVVTRGVVALVVVGALAATTGCSRDDSATPPPTITVAAASDLRPAFEAIARSFTATTGTRVTFSFGSSGQLRTQILNGAPFDLFASADAALVDEVVAAGRGRPETVIEYARGRIALWAADADALPASVADLAEPAYSRIAIANPAHAPYGRAAEQALERADVLDAVRSRLVLGETVADTFEIARSGNADVAIVAQSLAIADGSAYNLIPVSLHAPLRQALVVVTEDPDAGAAAEAFAEFVVGEGEATMARFGFEAPSPGTGTP